MNERLKSISGTFVRVSLTLAIAGTAAVTGVQLWRHYVLTPWTRDGRVVADSVTVAAEVSGRIVEIRVRENEYVRKGDILFTVDLASYKAAVDSAKANVASTLATMEMREANAARPHKLSRLSISAQEQEERIPLVR
jgi:multidrug resistance efflux pump